MADSSDQEKSLDPTPYRLKKAREDGNVMRAREIVSVGMLLTAVTTIAAGLPILFRVLQGMTERVLLSAAFTPVTVDSLPAILWDAGMPILLVLSPFFGALMVTAAGLNVVQSGWNMTLKPLQPKGNRVSPLSGIKRIFSAKTAFELGKSLIKIAVVGPMAYRTIERHLPDILMLHTLQLEEILAESTGWIVALLLKMIIALAVLAGIDFVFERWKHTKDLRMSHQEVKDETKNHEGNAQIKGRRRQIAREMLRRPRLVDAVLQADVVVTNPTHYAVALRYDPLTAPAPFVLVKGVRKRALRIKELAREHAIPTVENRPLARALHAAVDEGAAISEDLYPAVAALLAEIYRARQKTH